MCAIVGFSHVVTGALVISDYLDYDIIIIYVDKRPMLG